MIWAGQRIQTVHPNGQLMFGTEVVTSADKTLVEALLGASRPGAAACANFVHELDDVWLGSRNRPGTVSEPLYRLHGSNSANCGKIWLPTKNPAKSKQILAKIQ